MMKQFNKLVRNKILDIIKKNGDSAMYRILNDDAEYIQALLEKDEEELHELIEAVTLKESSNQGKDHVLEELVDKLEVLEALTEALGFSKETLYQKQREKREARGGFDKRIYLESTS